ncbi:MAG: fumarate/nitrate reduction transcriptional regulator Fnr [Gammaproteobacteria bacterium]|nr:fumarate/nitrate reduction transcriptional regulator Fnr [Gammaproteobacteria bacterium]
MLLQSIPIKVTLANLKSSCASCPLHELCLPMGLSAGDTERLDQIVNVRRKNKRGDYLYRSGRTFGSLYAIKSGFFKTFSLSDEGQERITGFYMTGDLLGMDAISSDRHHYNAVALEDGVVCEIPFTDLERLAGSIPALGHHFYKLMSREIAQEQQHMLLLGKMKAEQRLAAFLLNLSQRFTLRGFSPTRLHLCMTREEIGNYLGLTLETVSRTLAHFQAEGMIKVSRRDVTLRDSVRLAGLLDHWSQV